MLKVTSLVIIAQVLCTEVLATTSVAFHGITDTLKPEDEKYSQALLTAAEAFKEAEALFDDADFVARRGWKKETETDDGDVVYSKHTPKGKMVTVSTVLDTHVDGAIKHAWTGIDTLPTWNPNINYASIIVSLTNYTDIVTYGNNAVLIVSGRDFVSARLYRPLPNGGGYRMATRSVTVDSKPETKEKVRAHLHLGAVQFRPHPDHPETKTRCDVAMQVDMKGMLPTILVNQVLPKIMVMDTEENVKYFRELNKKAQ